MARYKPYDIKQITLVPVSFQDHILPGSFEYAVNEIVDEHIDMSPFEARHHNDETAGEKGTGWFIFKLESESFDDWGKHITRKPGM